MPGIAINSLIVGITDTAKGKKQASLLEVLRMAQTGSCCHSLKKKKKRFCQSPTLSAVSSPQAQSFH